MKKKLLLALSFVLFSLSLSAQSYFRVEVDAPGKLESSIPDQAYETMKVLSIKGPLNGTDIKFLRRILSCNYNEDPELPEVQSLNLADATIVPGGESYETYRDEDRHVHTYYTQADTIGPRMFFGFRKIQTLTLPKNTKYIGHAACFNLAIKQIVIPETCTGIGGAAFQWCDKMTNFRIIGRNLKSIGKLCFYNCENLQTINLPSSITELQGGVFAHCSELRSIKLPPQLTEIDSTMFYNCKALRTVVIPSKVKVIRSQAFEYSGVSTVQLNDQLESIESRAFYGCDRLSNIQIPNTVYNIMDGSFSGCFALPNGIPVQEDNPFFSTIDGSLFSKEGDIMYQLKSDPNIVEYTVPASVKEIAPHGLAYSFYLKKIILPTTLKNICTGGLYYLMNIEELHVQSAKPIDVGGIDAFDTGMFEKTTLFVPDNALNTYLTTPVWNEFQKIKPESLAAIEEVQVEKELSTEEVARYDLQGRRLTQPTKGIQIIRYRDGHSVKVNVQ